MHIKSLLNKVEKHKGFIYESVELVTNDSGEESLEVRIRPHQRNRPPVLWLWQEARLL